MGFFSLKKYICILKIFEMEVFGFLFLTCFKKLLLTLNKVSFLISMCFAISLTLECVLLPSQDLKILSECRRKVLPGGPRRVFRTRTSLTWSTPTDSTSSAGTGNPRAHPGKSPPRATRMCPGGVRAPLPLCVQLLCGHFLHDQLHVPF